MKDFTVNQVRNIRDQANEQISRETGKVSKLRLYHAIQAAARCESEAEAVRWLASNREYGVTGSVSAF